MAGELPAIRAVQGDCERVYGVPSVFSSTAGGDSPRESSEVSVTYGGDFPGDSSVPLTLWGLYKVSAISNQNFHLNFVQVTSHYINISSKSFWNSDWSCFFILIGVILYMSDLGPQTNDQSWKCENVFIFFFLQNNSVFKGLISGRNT